MNKYEMTGFALGFGLALLIVVLFGFDSHLRAITFAIGAGIGCYGGRWYGRQKNI